MLYKTNEPLRLYNTKTGIYVINKVTVRHVFLCELFELINNLLLFTTRKILLWCLHDTFFRNVGMRHYCILSCSCVILCVMAKYDFLAYSLGLVYILVVFSEYSLTSL